MHPDDLPARDFSSVTPDRLSAIIDAVQSLQAEKGGTGRHVAREVVLRQMARLEGDESLDSEAISHDIPQPIRLALQSLFDGLKYGGRASEPGTCDTFLDAVRPRRKPGRRHIYSRRAWEFARTLQRSDPTLSVADIKKAVRECETLRDERIPSDVKLFGDWLRRAFKEKFKENGAQ